MVEYTLFCVKEH